MRGQGVPGASLGTVPDEALAHQNGRGGERRTVF